MGKTKDATLKEIIDEAVDEIVEEREEKGEKFTVMIPPELWKRVEPLMEKLYLGKTNFACQAFDLFVIMQDKDPVP